MKDVFAERFRQERQAAQLSQDDIADVCTNKAGGPLSRAAVSLWEKPGRNKPTFENLVSIAKKLRCSIDYLTGLSDSKELGLARPMSKDNLASCIRIFEEMLPASEYKIPPDEKARIIDGMYKLIKPDGSIQQADIVNLIGLIRDRYPGGSHGAGVRGSPKESHIRLAGQGKTKGLRKLRR